MTSKPDPLDLAGELLAGAFEDDPDPASVVRMLGRDDALDRDSVVIGQFGQFLAFLAIARDLRQLLGELGTTHRLMRDLLVLDSGRRIQAHTEAWRAVPLDPQLAREFLAQTWNPDGDPWPPPGEYRGDLFRLMLHADPINLARFARAYPAEHAIVAAYRRDGGLVELQDAARQPITPGSDAAVEAYALSSYDDHPGSWPDGAGPPETVIAALGGWLDLDSDDSADMPTGQATEYHQNRGQTPHWHQHTTRVLSHAHPLGDRGHSHPSHRREAS